MGADRGAPAKIVLKMETFKNFKKAVLLNEGAGAGYYVTLSGLEAVDIELTGRRTEDSDVLVTFKAKLAESIVDWSAESYYEYVSSEGLYYNDDLVSEYDDDDKRVKGGSIEGYVYLSDVRYDRDAEDTEVLDYIKDNLQVFSVKTMVGGGYIHTSLTNPMVFKDTQTLDESTYHDGDTVYFDTLSIDAEGIVHAINWFFENSYKFDEIFAEDDDSLNEGMNMAVNDRFFNVRGKFLELKASNEVNTSGDDEGLFTWDEAMERFGEPDADGWRLPTEDEWDTIANDYSFSKKSGYGLLGGSVKMPFNGYFVCDDGEVKERGTHGYFWSSATKSDDEAPEDERALAQCFTSDYLTYYFQYCKKCDACSVRLVRDVK